jgi:hypothetical protein
MEIDQLEVRQLAVLKGYLMAVVNFGRAEAVPVSDVYLAIHQRRLLSLLSEYLGEGIEWVWFPADVWPEVEFYGALTCLCHHLEGREHLAFRNPSNGIELLSRLIDLVIRYMDEGSLDEFMSVTSKSVQLSPQLLSLDENDRFFAAVPYLPFPKH